MDGYVKTIWGKIKKEHKIAFLSAWITGLIIHIPVYLMDVPNHDGLASMYFDQNMITSGRWLLGIACSVSSYYTLPWLIGLLSLLWVSVAAVLLTELLRIRSRVNICLISMLLVSFPALASTYAYIFTADGYMLGLALAIASVLCTDRLKYGYIWGGICLACSLGIYQSYLPFAMILCLYMVLGKLLKPAGPERNHSRWMEILQFPLMGVIGFALYEGILHVLLLIQGKELDTYQGINTALEMPSLSFSAKIAGLYRDFFAFTLKGQVLYHNVVSAVLLLLILLMFLFGAVGRCLQKGYQKQPLNYVWILLFIAIYPICANIVLLISPDVNYHLLMRYQWVLLLILMVAICDKKEDTADLKGNLWKVIFSCALLCLVLFYGVTDNIAYSNLQKKYEKTYSYCLRLADRMEQTPGYYQGIPVAMIGVVSTKAYPQTDITGDVTSNMIGMTGDHLLYTAKNYQAFFKHYLGITMNIVDDDAMETIYYSDAYQSLDTFPGANAMKVVDGILYIKLE
ncbi:MAG: glucosyltransferase domain-containing protein [Lachnospiraceae bacterium]|nr:glucosyltransferase domain-containing protein [Lachnospiraceae bacterium]